jgi:isoquinoline 1-oxidoreductase subunit beta
MDAASASSRGGPWRKSKALHCGCQRDAARRLGFVKGRAKDTNLDTYAPLRMGDVPEMDIEFLLGTEVPTGLGEPATTVVGPAIGTPYFRGRCPPAPLSDPA